MKQYVIKAIYLLPLVIGWSCNTQSDTSVDLNHSSSGFTASLISSHSERTAPVLVARENNLPISLKIESSDPRLETINLLMNKNASIEKEDLLKQLNFEMKDDFALSCDNLKIPCMLYHLEPLGLRQSGLRFTILFDLSQVEIPTDTISATLHFKNQLFQSEAFSLPLFISKEL